MWLFRSRIHPLRQLNETHTARMCMGLLHWLLLGNSRDDMQDMQEMQRGWMEPGQSPLELLEGGRDAERETEDHPSSVFLSLQSRNQILYDRPLSACLVAPPQPALSRECRAPLSIFPSLPPFRFPASSTPLPRNPVLTYQNSARKTHSFPSTPQTPCPYSYPASGDRTSLGTLALALLVVTLTPCSSPCPDAPAYTPYTPSSPSRF